MFICYMLLLCTLHQLADGEGRASRLVIWSHPGNDVTGMVARSEKVAGICEKVRLLVSERELMFMFAICCRPSV